MEVELNYVSVNFKTKDTRAHENHKDLEIIYDEVQSGHQQAQDASSAIMPKSEKHDLEIIYDEVKSGQQQAQDASPVIPENRKKAPVCACLVVAVLGNICMILGSVLLYIHFSTMLSEQARDKTELAAKARRLQTEKVDLERRMEELTRVKDALNWTFRAILEYENFPVTTHCPQKVCKPCLDGWVLFQSNCYQFVNFDYSSHWKDWDGSRKECRKVNADLVVIESQEEQEFINNNTKKYNKDTNGYWIGSNRDEMGNWKWIDGSNVTVSYWREMQPRNSKPCALMVPHGDPLANWVKASCLMYNRWICETKALVKDSLASPT